MLRLWAGCWSRSPAGCRTALAYTIWFRGLERLPAAKVSLLGLLSPTVVGWAALGQGLTPLQLVGMAVAFGAVVWGQRRSAFSTMWLPKPVRAARSMARPSRSEVVMYFGTTRSSSGTSGAMTAYV